MYLLVNELSFEGQACDRRNAQQLMQDLISVIKSLKPIRVEDPIRTSRNLWAKELLPDYTVQQWLNDANKDQMRWFKAVVRKGPYIETLLDQELDYHECWYKDQDVSSTSLAGAVFYEGIVTSLKNSARFSLKYLPLRYRKGDHAFIDIEIINVYEPGSVETIIKEVLENFRTDISSWDDFWKKKETLFPDLLFCECVKKQLTSIDFEPVKVKGIIRHLAMMNTYFSVHNNSGERFDYTEMGIRASMETACTLDRYGYQREFECPDGEVRTFTWHSKLLGQNLRIHFYPPDTGNRNFLIGYIGQHLDTCKYH